jgi:hypothetical protein
MDLIARKFVVDYFWGLVRSLGVIRIIFRPFVVPIWGLTTLKYYRLHYRVIGLVHFKIFYVGHRVSLEVFEIEVKVYIGLTFFWSHYEAFPRFALEFVIVNLLQSVTIDQYLGPMSSITPPGEFPGHRRLRVVFVRVPRFPRTDIRH